MLRPDPYELPLPVSPPMVGWYRLVALVAAHILLAIFANGLLFQDPILSWLQALSARTAWLIQPTLMVNALALVLIVGAGIVMWCRVPLRQLGWRRAHLPRAVVALLALALLWLLCLAALSWWTPGTLALRPMPDSEKMLKHLGRLVGQLFGNALYEETFFRAFLFPQFFLLLSQKTARRRALIGAALASQALFAVSHLPNRLFLGKMDSIGPLLTDQMALFIVGMLYLVLWLRLYNLWLVIGLHAFVNMLLSEVKAPYALPVGAALLFGLLFATFHPRAASLLRRWCSGQ